VKPLAFGQYGEPLGRFVRTPLRQLAQELLKSGTSCNNKRLVP
jgi:hypothetical protein